MVYVFGGGGGVRVNWLRAQLGGRAVGPETPGVFKLVLLLGSVLGGVSFLGGLGVPWFMVGWFVPLLPGIESYSAGPVLAWPF